MINQTIKAEIGRTIFLTYFLVKDKIIEQFEQLKKKKIELKDFWKMLNFSFQKSKSHVEQEKNRIFTIFANIQDILNQSLPIEKIQPKKRENIIIERIEIALFQIENELFQFQNILNTWEYNEEFDCHQTKWEMTISDPQRGFNFFGNLSCSLNACPNRMIILQKIFEDNKKYIRDIIHQAKEICNEYHLKLDSNLYSTLTTLNDYFRGKKIKLNFKNKICWKLGDFLITFLVDEEKYVYTANHDHFLMLLIIKNMTNQLIEFEI
ncbi:MAG: hypothetical protein ACFFAN_12460 [Promethearchaeota archaeon]